MVDLQAISKLRVVDLKKELGSLGLNKNGRKAELIDRLVAHLSNAQAETVVVTAAEEDLFSRKRKATSLENDNTSASPNNTNSGLKSNKPLKRAKLQSQPAASAAPVSALTVNQRMLNLEQKLLRFMQTSQKQQQEQSQMIQTVSYTCVNP
jgi:SAP domain